MDMHSHLDDLTRALFDNLRGGKFAKGITEENELIQIMQMCPRCKINLIPLKLNRFEEEGQQYERILWICPRRDSRQCYFPMDMPLNVFWTKRTIQQIESNIMPLPNLHLLPERLHNLYPKLFSLQSEIDIGKLIQYAASVSKRVNPNATPEFPYSKTAPTVPLFTNAPVSDNLLFTTNRTLATTLSPSKLQQTVRAYLQQRLSSDKASINASENGETVNRKMVDLCPNANAALNSHLLLNGACNKQYIVHIFDPPQFIHQNVVGSGAISQLQLVRMQTQIRKSLEKVEQSSEKQNQTRSSKKHNIISIAKRKQNCDERYLSPIPPKYRYLTSSTIARHMEQTTDNKRRRTTNESIKPKKLPVIAENVLDRKTNKLNTESINARFGISSAKSECHVEIQEAVLPTKNSAFASQAETPFETIGYAKDMTSSSITSNTINSSPSNGTFPAHSMQNDDSDSGNYETRIGGFEPLDTDLEEKIRRKHEALFMEALKRKRNAQLKSSIASPTVNNQQSDQQEQQVQFQHNTSVAFDSEMQLAGIPHDYYSHNQIGVHRLSELTSFDYDGNEQSASRFAAYDSFGTVTELHSQQQNFDEEFDFGLGLEEGFTNAQNHHDDNPMMDEGSFLRQLSGLPI